MTTKELIGILKKHIDKNNKCCFIKFHITHYKIYFLVRKIKKQDQFHDVDIIPFFIWRIIIVKYLIILCIIIYLLHQIDNFINIKNVSILFDLPISQIAILVFIYKAYVYRSYRLEYYYQSIEKNIQKLKQKPNIELFKSSNSLKANNSYIRKANYKKKK